MISSKASDENTESVYENYYDYAEAMGKIAGHRVLALDRGEKEGVLKVSVNVRDILRDYIHCTLQSFVRRLYALFLVDKF